MVDVIHVTSDFLCISQVGGHCSACPSERRRSLLVSGGCRGNYHASGLLHQEPGGLSGQETVTCSTNHMICVIK